MSVAWKNISAEDYCFAPPARCRSPSLASRSTLPANGCWEMRAKSMHWPAVTGSALPGHFGSARLWYSVKTGWRQIAGLSGRVSLRQCDVDVDRPPRRPGNDGVDLAIRIG